jgi:integrase
MTKVTLHKVKRPRPPGKDGKDKPPRQVWMLRWYGSDGKRYGETIGDCRKVSKREAGGRRREKQSKLDCHQESPDKPKRMTLAEFLRRDREAVNIDVKPRTIEEMNGAAKHATAALGSDFDIRAVDHVAVGRVKKHLAERDLAPATIVKVMTHLQGAFSRGVPNGSVTANPFLPRSKRRPHGVRLPRVPRGAVRVYKPHEVEAILAVAPSDWWRAFIRLAYTSGLRAGELFNLLWTDVDLDEGTVSVRAKKVGAFEVGGERLPILAWTSKTYENRTVPIPMETVEALRAFRGLKLHRSAYVFLSLDRLAQIREHMAANVGKLPPSYKLVNNLKRRWDRIQAAAAARLSKGMEEPYEWESRTIHDLRRTYGTMLARHVPLHELKQLMGHSSIRTTERFYLAVGDDLGQKVETVFGSGHTRDTLSTASLEKRAS